ncbi:hypothetical protein RZS08_62245, partial [Arthrospira platensis SPKY1]|nr:hypothetical protein [Arthrospira platensis SPKY1]
RIHRAQFDTEQNGIIEFVNKPIEPVQLMNNPFIAYSNSQLIKVIHFAHNLIQKIGSETHGCYAKFSGVNTGDTAFDDLLNRDDGFEVLWTDINSYVIDCG